MNDELSMLNFRDKGGNPFKYNWEKEDWEFPLCGYCGSDYFYHKQIYYNVKNTHHSLVECQKCKLRFYSPRIKFSSMIKAGFGTYETSKKEALFVYDNASYFKVENREEQINITRSYYAPYLEKLMKVNGVPEDIFEVGGGIGWLGYFYKEKYKNIIYDGCEINKYCVEIARKEFGLNYNVGEFRYYNIDKLYDCGIMMDYIEHSYSPMEDLRKIADMIKFGGVFMLKTFLEELDTKREMEAPFGHAYHFYGDVLRKMLEEVGFEIVHWIEDWVMVTVIARKK